MFRRAAFFAHPKNTAAAVWATSSFVFLLPTIIELKPLGSNQRDAKGERDRAKADYYRTLTELNKITASIVEAKQRVIDLDCAMAGYQKFNEMMNTFQNRILNSTGTPLEKLNAFWQLQYNPDKNNSEQDIVPKQYVDSEYKYEYYYSCLWHSCKKDENCCSDWGWHWVDQTYYYNEITTILNDYQNIVTGAPLYLPSLNCGYYSRRFGTNTPVTYQTDESVHRERGDKRAGTVYIDFTRKYGSSVTSFYGLDGNNNEQPNTVIRDTDRYSSAYDLVNKLNNYVAMAVAAFNMAGANYPQLQNSIRNQIPVLIENAARANATLYDESKVLAEKQAKYSDVDDEFKQGLSLWLPMLFLIPGALALFVYWLLIKCKDNPEARDDLELDLGRSEARRVERIVMIEDEDKTPAAAYVPLQSHTNRVEGTGTSPSAPLVDQEGQPSSASMRKAPSYSPSHFSRPPAETTTSEGPPPPYQDDQDAVNGGIEGLKQIEGLRQ